MDTSIHNDVSVLFLIKISLLSKTIVRNPDETMSFGILRLQVPVLSKEIHLFKRYCRCCLKKCFILQHALIYFLMKAVCNISLFQLVLALKCHLGQTVARKTEEKRRTEGG